MAIIFAPGEHTLEALYLCRGASVSLGAWLPLPRTARARKYPLFQWPHKLQQAVHHASNDQHGTSQREEARVQPKACRAEAEEEVHKALAAVEVHQLQVLVHQIPALDGPVRNGSAEKGVVWPCGNKVCC